MKKLKALVVVHATLVPPDSLDGRTEKEIEEWRTEFDVISTLKKRGHEVRCVGVLDTLTELRSAITDWQPDIVFNLLEEFDGIVTYDQHVVAFLELMRQPYTGSNPRGLLLSRDKSICKQLFAYHRIPSPQFAVFRKGVKFKLPKKLRFPLFVKSTTEDASLGIAQASVVEDEAKLRERVGFVHEQIGSDAPRREYIEGRVVRRVLGNERLTPAGGKWSSGRCPIALGDRDPQGSGIAATRRSTLTTRAADELPPRDRHASRCAVAAHLSRTRPVGLRAWTRLAPDGRMFVLEANANPNLAEEEDFAQSALAAGIAYDELLERIITLGRSYRVEWRV